MTRRALTLVELLVAITVATIVAGSATASLSGLLRARRSSIEHWLARSRAHAVADQIAEDVAACVRDADLAHARLVILDAREGTRERDEVLLLTRGVEAVRGIDFEGEGAEFEVQYRVAPGPGGGEFWRRRDPALDEYQDAGGVASRLAVGAVALSIEATDGVTWYATWDTDRDGIPYGVRITTTARGEEGRVTATARRLVALDRVALPPETSEEDATDDATGTEAAAGGGGGAAR